MKLIIDASGRSVSWQNFTRNTPEHSIALDGYVCEGSRFNPSGPWANFNHHEGVSRLETRATCAQVLVAMRQGLFQTFDPDRMTAYVNDCDEDVCLSVYLLRQPAYEQYTSWHEWDSRINELVFLEDMLDTTGGAFAVPDTLVALQELLWVFAPYHEFRASGELHKRDSFGFARIIDEVGQRAEMYVCNKGGRIQPDTRSEIIDDIDNGRVIFVKEIGANARLGAYGRGAKAFVAVRELPDSMYAYSLGRASQFVPFPIPKILKALNTAETHEWRGMTEAMPDERWGGSDIIAGSPRGGSILTPRQVKEVIQGVIKTH